jgi:hypothetical protein
VADIHAVAHYSKGSYQTARVDKKPALNLDMLSLNEPIAKNDQLVFWYPKALSLDTAKWLAKQLAVDLRQELSDHAK